MKIWMPVLGGESLYEADLPACCARDARATTYGGEAAFECASCGAAWQAGLPVETEEDTFLQNPAERRGAA